MITVSPWDGDRGGTGVPGFLIPLLWRHNGSDGVSISSLTIVYSTAYSGANQRKHQSSASLAFVRGIHRWPVNSPHKWPVTRKMLGEADVAQTDPCMMMSSNGSIFRVTGLLWGEFTGHRWIPLTKASDAELWCFLWSTAEQTIE